MLPQEIILNLIFSGLASIAFFYVYKRTHLNAMLIAGAITYFELLCRLFAENIPQIMYGTQLLVVPEFMIILYMTWYTYREGFRWTPLMLILLIITFTMMLNLGHTFYGDVGVMFGLIMIIWVNQSTTPCNLNPWECQKQNQETHCKRSRRWKD